MDFEYKSHMKLWQMEFYRNKQGNGKKRRASIKKSRIFQMTLKGWGFEVLLGGILTIKHFCYAEGDTWHRLIKIKMTYVHMKPEVKKKWSNSSYCSYKWSLYWVITWRLQLRVEGMTLFIGEDVNLVMEILLVRRLRKIFA